MQEIEILLVEQGIPYEEIQNAETTAQAVDEHTLEDFADWVRERDCIKRLAFRIGNTVDE